MPLPLGHTVVGYCVTAASGIRFRKDVKTALLFSVVVANLPDLDFLPGLLSNEPDLYHRTIAHTLPAALLCGVIISAILTRFRGRFLEMALLGFLVYSSHLFADMVRFSPGNVGVQILWPFSHNWYTVPSPISDGTAMSNSRGAGAEGFASSFATLAFIRASVLQALLFLPLLIPALLMRSLRERKAGRSKRQIDRKAERQVGDLGDACGVD